jgi:hypothetical protein
LRRLTGLRRLTRTSCRTCAENPAHVRQISFARAPKKRRTCAKKPSHVRRKSVARATKHCRTCDVVRWPRARRTSGRSAQCAPCDRCGVRARATCVVASGRGRRQGKPRRPPVPIICAAAAKAPRWSPKPARGARTGTAPARSPGTWPPSTRPPSASPPGAAQRRGRTPSATCSGRCASGARGPSSPGAARSRASANGMDARRALQRRVPAAAPARMWRAGAAVGSALLRATHCQQCVRLPPAARSPAACAP